MPTRPEQKNAFKDAWNSIVSPDTLPTRFRSLHQIEYSTFQQKVLEQDQAFVTSITRSLYEGDVYIIRGAFSKAFIGEMKRKTAEYCKDKPPTFHKMLEGCQDFHRVIDEEVAKNYSFKAIKHSCYFFPWNDDPLKLFSPIWERWSLIKFLSGQRLDEYERNTPKDGIVDRIQIVCYPSGAGVLETHSDPYIHQRLFISGFMSKRGEEFDSGGFYVIGPGNEQIDLEGQVEIGDMAFGYATVLHGVAAVDSHKSVDWGVMQGRWFLGLYSNASDEVKNRHTGYAVKLDEER
ncbi:MAG TPA: hypothetical protein EYN18_01960 [Nitrospirales bacterium]|nr:hypothetical protein [Nitrospirales bacterium]HIB54571.1 hypothetical protein [Nitrospirales bacterium]HIC05235.1 hypothetical protein [Nitrospirales bacterium]HIO21148.1 hypothetical protein [Nitrospirales bacterium]HIO70064.1 hypothetical protein [Nitrospirales bacterium]